MIFTHSITSYSEIANKDFLLCDNTKNHFRYFALTLQRLPKQSNQGHKDTCRDTHQKTQINTTKYFIHDSVLTKDHNSHVTILLIEKHASIHLCI